MRLEIDRLLARFSRRLPFSWKIWSLQRRLRLFFSSYYRGRSSDLTVIDDYDHDIRMKLRRSTYLGGLIYWNGYQSKNELILLERLLEPDMTFVDIGANMGEFTLFAAKRLPRGEVIAFEPQQAIFELLQENVKLNQFQQVTLYQAALSDHTGRAPIYTAVETEIHGALNEGLASLYESAYRGEVIGEVDLYRLDDILATCARVDIIKIDVEGAELSVLRGAVNILRQHRPLLLIEVNEDGLVAAGHTSNDLLGFLSGLGYGFERIVNDRRGSTEPLAGQKLPPLSDLLCRPLS